MDEKKKKQRFDLFEKKCRERGIPSTVQRHAVLDIILDSDHHPTTDQVFDAVRERVPGISRTTVYRTLETLVRMGIITKTCHPGSAVRYDPRVELHHHLVCLYCDDVIDINDEQLDSLPVPDTSREEFEVFDFRVQLRGICRNCKKKEVES
jgi:Fur family peroxide stress response transcriptional regulator